MDILRPFSYLKFGHLSTKIVTEQQLTKILLNEEEVVVGTRGRNRICDVRISCFSSLNLDSIGIKMTLRSVATPIIVPLICGI